MRRLAISAFSFAAAVFLCVYAGIPQRICFAVAAIGAAAFCALLAVRTDRGRAAVLVSLGLCAGFAWCGVYTSVFVAPAVETYGGKTAEFTVVASDFSQKTDYGSRFPVKIKVAGHRDADAMLFVFDSSADSVRPGDTVTVTAEARAGDSDYSDYYASRGFELSLFSKGGAVVDPNGAPTFGNFPKYMAKQLKDRIAEIFPEDVLGFMTALMTGDRVILNKDGETVDALQKSGIYHVVAVSGLHVSFVTGFVYTLFGKRKWAAFAAIPAAFVFAAVAGFTPSVTRAAIMQAFVLSAPLFNRENDPITSLSFALAAILVFNPSAAKSVGLQLSFSATLGIILMSSRIYEALSKVGEHVKKIKCDTLRKAMLSAIRFVFGTVSVTAGATVFTVPLSALYFGYVSLVAVFTNLALLWLVTIIFYLGFIAVAVSALYVPLGMFAASAAAVPMRVFISAVMWIADLWFASVSALNPFVVWWLVLNYALVVLAWMMHVKLRELFVPALVSVGILCSVLLGTVLYYDTCGLRFTVLDVGQGQSILIKPGRYTVAVDCGGADSDAGARLCAKVEAMGRTRLDLVVLTHCDSDHVNGLDTVLSRLNVGAIALPKDDDGGEYVAELANKYGVELIYVTETLSVALDETELTLYAPPHTARDGNAGVSVYVSGEEFSAMITGDMDMRGEAALVSEHGPLDADIFVVGHHGSKSSTSDTIIEAVTPEYAVISVGQNSYGHPAQETLDRLERYGVTVMRTDTDGDITFRG